MGIMVDAMDVIRLAMYLLATLLICFSYFAITQIAHSMILLGVLIIEGSCYMYLLINKALFV